MSTPELDDFRLDSDWRMLGACRGIDPGVFFPDDDEGAEIAKAICAECAVRVVCLEFALETREKTGVWGGTTEKERRRIIRQRSLAARRA